MCVQDTYPHFTFFETLKVLEYETLDVAIADNLLSFIILMT
jgi:hypothetical protein